MIKVLVRAEVGTRDDAILDPDKFNAARSKFDKAVKRFASNAVDNDGNTLDVRLSALFFQGQLFIDPEDRSRFPSYATNEQGEDVDVPIVVDTLGVAFGTDDGSKVSQVMEKLSADVDLTSFYGLAWKFYDKDTDLPLSAR